MVKARGGYRRSSMRLRALPSLLLTTAMLAGCGDAVQTEQQPPVPALTPLLGAPAPAGPTARGVYVQDPEGQIEQLTARGQLVAWTVRTPADALPSGGIDGRPRRLPTTTTVVIAEERGGPPATVELKGRWVRRLHLVRGTRGEPQLAVESCTTHATSSCVAELLSLTPTTPPTVAGRTRGAAARAAVLGLRDSGRRLAVATRRPRKVCTARLTVREQDGSTRRLPRLPKRDAAYPRCEGLSDWWISGTHVFAGVDRSNPEHHLDAEIVYGLDLAAGPAARWHELYAPYRSSDGSAGLTAGPAVTDAALFYEELDDESELAHSLSRITLPGGDLQVTDEPVAPGAADTCHIAATDTAIYELSNPRCAIFQDLADGTGGQIARIVNPAFKPPED